MSEESEPKMYECLIGIRYSDITSNNAIVGLIMIDEPEFELQKIWNYPYNILYNAVDMVYIPTPGYNPELRVTGVYIGDYITSQHHNKISIITINKYSRYWEPYYKAIEHLKKEFIKEINDCKEIEE